ncbi:unnamed protein product [Ostreobium quekettii]|uniref:PsbP C-terminal domain-containing protein n=1 Tax=Ostreobium quekettii TaxID=121088 RepID=A0A8S1IL98_9CHLO|nr:unnamed protein product [Ostreobium quekettii]|eukprot:evm.model.scf_254EXC.3 EVM.evm.TU.scf_254EXC.3   scf_254EXC:10562-12294(+)
MSLTCWMEFDWIILQTAGNDVAFRDPVNVDKNLFVNLSSPSSSKYAVVSDLGSPQDAAQRILQQYLAEFMSTRIGVQREGDIISAEQRTGPDGKLYYDVQIRLRSYASRNPLAVTSQERDMGVELEWDRLLIAVLGVANKRLYEMRLQTNFDVSESELSKLGQTAVSFECQEV